MIKSSYAKNNFGPIFKNTIISFKPHVCVELGVLNGYSTFWTAFGLKHNHLIHFHRGHLHCYDLWEDYAFSHGDKKEVENLLEKNKVSEYVTLNHGNAFDIHSKWGNKSLGFLHVDISNDGETVKQIMENWHPKLSMGGLILFEGGSEERDKIEWMKKYNKKSIRKEINENKIINLFYQYGTYNKFPSLTIMVKKGE